MDLKIVKSNLEQRGFTVEIFEHTNDAAEYLDTKINHTTVGLGGSVSLREMGIFDLLRKHNQVWWHNNKEQVEEYGAFAVREIHGFFDFGLSVSFLKARSIWTPSITGIL